MMSIFKMGSPAVMLFGVREAEAPNAIMGWTMFQPRREQWTRQRYHGLPESLRSRPQLENGT